MLRGREERRGDRQREKVRGSATAELGRRSLLRPFEVLCLSSGRRPLIPRPVLAGTFITEGGRKAGKEGGRKGGEGEKGGEGGKSGEGGKGGEGGKVKGRGGKRRIRRRKKERGRDGKEGKSR